MKFLIPTVLTLLFFSPTSVSADEVKDVDLICEENDGENPEFFGFWLKGSGKTDWYVRDSYDDNEDGNRYELIIAPIDRWEYHSTENVINFKHIFENGKRNIYRNKKLDRFTAEMTETYSKIKIIYQCEVYRSSVDFLDGLTKKEEIVRRHFKKRKI